MNCQFNENRENEWITDLNSVLLWPFNQILLDFSSSWIPREDNLVIFLLSSFTNFLEEFRLMWMESSMSSSMMMSRMSILDPSFLFLFWWRWNEENRDKKKKRKRTKKHLINEKENDHQCLYRERWSNREVKGEERKGVRRRANGDQYNIISSNDLSEWSEWLTNVVVSLSHYFYHAFF